MKVKLVLVGGVWTRAPHFMRVARFFSKEEPPFLDELGEICERNIPDFKDWGPAEAYYQLPDYALPIGRNNQGKVGITICFSQLYEKEGRDIRALTTETLELVIDILKELGVSGLQLFSETHVSDESGKSFFIEVPVIWL